MANILNRSRFSYCFFSSINTNVLFFLSLLLSKIFLGKRWSKVIYSKKCSHERSDTWSIYIIEIRYLKVGRYK